MSPTVAMQQRTRNWFYKTCIKNCIKQSLFQIYCKRPPKLNANDFIAHPKISSRCCCLLLPFSHHLSLKIAIGFRKLCKNAQAWLRWKFGDFFPLKGHGWSSNLRKWYWSWPWCNKELAKRTYACKVGFMSFWEMKTNSWLKN